MNSWECNFIYNLWEFTQKGMKDLAFSSFNGKAEASIAFIFFECFMENHSGEKL
jgi:hypothetical protein